MPRVWNDALEEHRRDVRSAILDAGWALATERGITAVKMSHVAEQAGIGRPTLYKYFSDVESILVAWHERHVAASLDRLTRLHDRPGSAAERLRSVLTEYANIARRQGSHAAELTALLHRDQHAHGAQHQVLRIITDLLTEAAAEGHVRKDVPPSELTQYCIHALNTASSLRSSKAVGRLVNITLSGLEPPE